MCSVANDRTSVHKPNPCGLFNHQLAQKKFVQNRSMSESPARKRPQKKVHPGKMMICCDGKVVTSKNVLWFALSQLTILGAAAYLFFRM